MHRAVCALSDRHVPFHQEESLSQRRMSDPSQAWNKFMRGSFKSKGIRKSCSETERVDSVGTDGTAEVEASHIQDG